MLKGKGEMKMQGRYLVRAALLSIVVSSMVLANESDALTLENITVSANKIEENIQDVPQSITVIDEAMIEEKGIKSIADVIHEIPNMYITPKHGGVVNFRGLNTSMFTNNNPVVIYIDGIPTTDRNAFDVSMENVERVEVLRGPQGTLYGKDAIGAVINIVTKKPTNTPYGSVGMEYGSNNTMRETFNVNAPIIENKLFINLNGAVSSSDGWVTNTYNADEDASKEKEKRFSTALLYNINDRLSAQLVLKREETKNYWGNDASLTNVTSLSAFSRDLAENASFDVPTLEESVIDSQSLSLKYGADHYTIEAVGTHKKNDFNSVFDADFTSGTLYDGTYMQRDTTADTYTGEIRIASNNDQGIRWVGGIYADTEEKTFDPYSVNYYISDIPYAYGNAVSTSNSDTQALFAQTMIPLSDTVELTLGGRYQTIKKKIDMTVTNYMLGYGTSSFDFDAQKRWNTFIPKAALSYKINDTFTSFVSISKGYMPGGFNNYASSSDAEQNTFEPQQSTNYEIGIKGVIDNATFTATLFRMDIKDIHVYRQSSGYYYTDNADKAHSQGVEFDFRYFPIDSIELSGAVGLIDTKYDSYNAGDYDFSGEKIENTPTYTANLGLAYYHPSGFYARSDVRSQGSLYFYDDLQKKFLKNDSYAIVDLKMGYKFSNWDIYGFVKNVTDEEYLTYYQSSSLVSLATYGDSRILGVGVHYKF